MQTTFSIYESACRKPFVVSHHVSGKWAVGRFNNISDRLERWGLYTTEDEARHMARCVNSEIDRLPTVSSAKRLGDL